MPDKSPKPRSLKVAMVGNAATSNKGNTVNSGNMMHGAAARNLIGDFIEAPGRWNDQDVERISTECSHIVFVAANGIRPGAPDDHPFTRNQSIITENILRTDLPVVVFGLGVQSKLGKLPAKTIPSATLRLLEVLSERSKEIAVRGHFTAEYLNDLGIKNTKALGCQSCFYHATPKFTAPKIKAETNNIAFNYTAPNREKNAVSMAIRGGFSMFGQEETAETNLLNGDSQFFDQSPKLRKFFWRTNISRKEYADWLHQYFCRFYDMPSWFEKMQAFDFSFGTRFHGNMVALQCGVPALWVVHDTRTMELCDYLALPYMMRDDVEKIRDISQLLEAADYGPFEKAYGENYARLFAYLQTSGMAHSMPVP
ncbi:MAG: polysaccharide pyruvyl transferase family protein [Rhodobacteraceae bacterium]|nr:polysaccharide pyruvyl transferase family protein [Paracoccaceae bacterium]